MAAAANSPRYPTAATNSATNPGQLSWYTKVHSMSCSEPYGAGALASTDNPSDGRKWRPMSTDASTVGGRAVSASNSGIRSRQSRTMFAPVPSLS